MSGRQKRLGDYDSSRAAFTLVELLVVVGIIALLIAILLPSLGRARSQARMAQCRAHMRGLGQAAMTFANDHRDHMQVATDEVGLKRADPLRTRYAYDGNRELLAWPVALAQASGVPYTYSGMAEDPENDPRTAWGIRDTTFQKAFERKAEIPGAYGLLMCPADKIQISTPFYPRHKSAGNNGIKKKTTNGLWEEDEEAEVDAAYWGYLSFGINEDILGVEVEESNGKPACYRTAWDEEEQEWVDCRGEFSYPPSHPCSKGGSGWRLRGLLTKVHAPSTAGLIFEAGPEDITEALQAEPEEFANLIISAQTEGPYLADFQQKFGSRMPRKRHLDSRLNVLFADMHGDSVLPVEFDDDNDFELKLPSRYSPNVRVSPYAANKPEEDEE